MACKFTVGDLKKELDKLPDNLPIIYSHDDEGNEFQYVISLPSILYVKNKKGYRFLEVEDEDDVKDNPEFGKCVCIN